MVAKFRFDTAENEPRKEADTSLNTWLRAMVSSAPLLEGGHRPALQRCSTRLATTHHPFLGSLDAIYLDAKIGVDTAENEPSEDDLRSSKITEDQV